MTSDPPSGGPRPTDHDLRLQQVVDALVTGHTGRPPRDIETALVLALEREDLSPMTPSWVRAVAESASAGNAYVVSEGTRRAEDIPDPDHPDPSFGRS